MYQYIFFDLDGTLTDPREGITKGIQYALAHMGIEEPDLTKLERFIGPPLTDSFMEHYGFTAGQAAKSVDYYQEYFSVHGVYQNKLFAGVKEMLQNLKAHNRVLAIASSKPEVFAEKIVKYFDIDELLDNVCGSIMDTRRSKKAEVIEELMNRLQITEDMIKGNKILMVGDRRYDVEGAAAFGIPCLGLDMGFAEEGELEKAGAIAVVDNLKEAETFMLQE